MHDETQRTPEQERIWREKLQQTLPIMDDLDFELHEHRPETTLDREDMAQVIGLRRR